MSAIEQVYINKKYTCGITGHRRINQMLDKKKVEERLKNIILNYGVDTFLIGMAVGFDTFCFNVLDQMKREINLRIIACVPCLDQDKNFNFFQKSEYQKLLKKADEIIVLSEEYTPYCMLKRNRFIVDNSSVLLAYLKEEKGGTKYTVDYAEKKGLKIERI